MPSTYRSNAKFNKVTRKFEVLGGSDYWLEKGVADDKAGRQMSAFFNVSHLEENRKEAQRKKELLKKKNINWKKIQQEKKIQKKKKQNQWLFED